MTALPRPDSPPSHLVRAAKDRLLAALRTDPAAADRSAPTFPVVGPAVSDQPTPWPGLARLAEPEADDRYEFGEAFAAGGLGLVRRARDRRLGRVVAVKELLRSDPGAERRFALEAAITARLQHPGIIPLYDIGRHPTGEPYYCMKLVDGESLEHGIRRCQGLVERLALLEHVIAAADAVAHAHRHGVVHRDLKPANILVGERGETVVIDWGLAKDTTGAAADELPDLPPPTDGATSTMTEHGTVLGTLRYMPPEQARGEPVDARSDVFALGAVLFHVLAGVPPHDGVDARQLAARIAAGVVDDLRARVPDGPRELLAIVERATAPDPADRYPTAEAFAEDLRRFRTGRLVNAHRYSAREVALRWLRRHRAVTSVTAAALVTVAGLGAVAVQNVREERDLAAAARQDAVDARERVEAALLESRAQARSALLAQARGALDADLAGALATLARVDLSEETSTRRARLLALAAESRGAPSRVLRGHVRPVARLAALVGGDLVSLDLGGVVRRWDPRTGAGADLLDLAEQGAVLVAARDVPVFAVIGETQARLVRADGTIEALDVSLVPRGLPRAAKYRWELSAGGETLAALGEPVDGGTGAPAYLWDLRTAPATASALPGVRAGVAALRPDGRAVAVETQDGPVALHTDGAITRVPGLRRALGFASGGAHLFGFPSEPLAEFGLVTADLATGAVHPIGRWTLGTTRDDHALAISFEALGTIARLSLRSLATGDPRWSRFFESDSLNQWHEYGDYDALLDPRGDGLAIRARDHWLLGSQRTGELPRRLDTGAHLQAAWLADGGFAVARHADVWLWDGPSASAPSTLPPSPPSPDPLAVAPSADAPLAVYAALAPDGARAVVHRRGGEPALLDMSSRTETAATCLAGLTSAELADPATRVVLDVQGRLLVAGPRGACVQDPAGAAHPLELPGPALALALAARGEGLAAGLADGTVLRWRAPAAAPARLSLGAAIVGLTLLPDDAGLVARTRDSRIVAIRGEVVTPLATIDASQGMPYRAAISPVVAHPSAPVAAIAGDDTLLHHDFATGATTRRPVLLPHLPALAYSPGGRLAVSLAGTRLLVLDAAADPGRELALPEEARALTWLDDQELIVLGDRGSLLRADLVAGEVALLRHDWHPLGELPTELVLAARPTGAVALHTRADHDLVEHPADVVPRDPAQLAAWLQRRGAALGGP